MGYHVNRFTVTGVTETNMDTKDPLENELGKYENKWVAISEPERRVVGSGNNAIEAKADAEAKGYTDTALFKVRASGKMYVYAL